jgi:hypothetical protein
VSRPKAQTFIGKGGLIHVAQPKLGYVVQRPLFGVKWTWRGLVGMSATDPKQKCQSVARSRT